MANDKNKIYELALKVAEEKKCYFIEQVISHIPISKPTFYSYYPTDSNEFNEIKEIIDNNRVDTKSLMYNKWFKSENATLQISLMKLIGSEEERKKLSQSYNDITTKGEAIKDEIDYSKLSDKALEEINNLKDESKSK